jgi:hypothetical protein
VLKDESSTGQLGSSQEKTWLRSETSANDKTKPDVENGPEEVATKQNKVPEAKTETMTKIGTSS